MRGVSQSGLLGLILLGTGWAEPALARIHTVGFQSLTMAPWVAQTSCGKAIPPLDLYQTISTYSLIVGFVFVFAAIFMERKKIKLSLSVAAVIPLLIWGYVNFLVDYDHIRKSIFNYNSQAEATLANIAEAQARYKSEHQTYLKDLKELESHLAGAHGLDECVKIIELNVGWDHWSAKAQHVSSPESVHWDSTSGSSLKKG